MCQVTSHPSAPRERTGIMRCMGCRAAAGNLHLKARSAIRGDSLQTRVRMLREPILWSNAWQHSVGYSQQAHGARAGTVVHAWIQMEAARVQSSSASHSNHFDPCVDPIMHSDHASIEDPYHDAAVGWLAGACSTPKTRLCHVPGLHRQPMS